jgi:pimeloyl-ACP methyl ester carboxylesterase
MTETEISFYTARGIRISGVLCLPDDPGGSARLPGVVLCQGLSGVKHLVLPEVAAGFSRRGLASLRFDYAGYGGSAGERGWIDPRARVDDSLYAFAWLAAHPSLDADRIGIYGHSYGGAIAIGVAARERRARAVVSVSGPGSGPEMLAGIRASWDWIAFKQRVEDERTKVAQTGQPTLVDVTDILPFSPAFAAAYAKLKAEQGGTSAREAGDGTGISRFWLSGVDAMLDFQPEDAARRLGQRALLLVHGENDDVASIESIAAIHANAPGPKRWEIVPRAGHNDLDSGSGLAHAIDLAAAWFCEHL